MEEGSSVEKQTQDADTIGQLCWAHGAVVFSLSLSFSYPSRRTRQRKPTLSFSNENFSGAKEEEIPNSAEMVAQRGALSWHF